MRAVVTRVSSASVSVEGQVIGSIQRGYLVLLGIGQQDTVEIAQKLAEKICHLRLFEDEDGKMNQSLEQVGGALLAVSQFTLFGNTKSRRPSFSQAAPGEVARPIYQAWIQACRTLGFTVEQGQFGAHMEVASVNDGPVTLWIDTEGSQTPHKI